MLDTIGTISLAISAILTGLVVWIAWSELGGSRKISQDTFVRDFTKNFAQPATKFLFALCENNALLFKTRRLKGMADKKREVFPYFTFDKNIVKQIELYVPEYFKNNKISYRVADDFLLVYFEDIGLFLEEGLVSRKMLYESWGFCIETVWENKAIREFIEWMRANNSRETYKKFELAYNTCKEFKVVKNVKS